MCIWQYSVSDWPAGKNLGIIHHDINGSNYYCGSFTCFFLTVRIDSDLRRMAHDLGYDRIE